MAEQESTHSDDGATNGEKGGGDSDGELSAIETKVSRVEEIIDILEDGSPSLKRAKELREEGETLLKELRDDLEVSDGEVSEE